jgi:hypothetical protein
MSGGTSTNKPASASPTGNDDDNLPQVAIPAAKTGQQRNEGWLKKGGILTYKPRYFIEYDGKIYYKRKKEDQKAREYFPINKIIAIQITKELELEFTLTVVGTGGDKLIYMQALNREDFDRWVKIFVERTGLPVFDANQQVMPKYKSKGAKAYTNVGEEGGKSDFAKTHPGVKVVAGAAPEVQRTVQRVVTPSRPSGAVAKPASESNSLASSSAEQPRDLLVDLSDPTPTTSQPNTAPSMLPVDDEVAKGLLERNQSLLSQLDQQFNLNEALQGRISDLIQQLHQQVLLNQHAQQQLVDLTNTLNDKTSAVEALQQQLTAGGESSAKLNEVTEQLAHQTQVNANLQTQVTHLTNQLNDRLHMSQERHSQVDELENKMRELNEELAASQLRVTELTGQLMTEQERVKQLETTVEELNSRVTNETVKESALSHESEEWQRKYDEECKQRALLEQRLAQLQTQRDELQTTEATHNQEWEQERHSLNETVSGLKEEKTKLSEEVAELNEEVAQLRSSSEDTEKQNQILNENVTALNSVIVKLTSTNQQLLTELNAYKQKVPPSPQKQIQPPKTPGSEDRL